MKLKLICLLLALVLLAGCTPAPQEGTSAPTQGTPAPTEGTTLPVETMTFEEVKNPATFLSISLSVGDQYRSMTAYPDENGMTFVEFVGDVKKVGTLSPLAIHGITKAVEESGMLELNGVNDYDEKGNSYASAYVSYKDETYLGVGYSGVVADAYTAAYEFLENYFEMLTAAMPVYVPRPVVSGEVSEPELNALIEILDGSGMEMLDAFVIGPVLKDDTFAFTAGLSDDTHVLSGASCGAMMTTTPYSLVVVRVDDPKNIDMVREDFAKNLNWNKWICVSATNAVIAQKGDLVLCLMGSSTDFTMTLQGIRNAGWEAIEEYRAH